MLSSSFRVVFQAAIIGGALFSSGYFPDSAQAEIVNPDWKVADVLKGAKPSFDFDAQGRFHVMGMIEAFENQGGQVWYAVADSIDGPWSPKFVAPGYFYGPGDIRVDKTGTANVIWHNHEPGDPNHATISPSGASNWIKIDTPGHNGWDNAAALDRNGVLHTSSVHPTGFGPVTNSLEFGTFNGSSWNYQSVPGSGTFRYGMNTSLAFDSDNDPGIVFCDCDGFTASGGALRYARQESGFWQFSTITSGGLNGRFPVMAIDAQDQTHVAWVDIDPQDTTRGSVRYGVWDGATWNIETVDTLEDIFLSDSSFGARKLVSIELDSEGRPHLAFGDNRFVKHALLSDNDWTITTVAESQDLQSSSYNGQVVMRLDANDSPAIAFWQMSGGAGSPGMVRLASLSRVPGDTNGDGVVNRDDFLTLVDNYGTSVGSTLAGGDLTGDGATGLADLILLQRNFGGAAGSPVANSTAVPEPSSIVLLFISLSALGLFRLRRNHFTVPAI